MPDVYAAPNLERNVARRMYAASRILRTGPADRRPLTHCTDLVVSVSIGTAGTSRALVCERLFRRVFTVVAFSIYQMFVRPFSLLLSSCWNKKSLSARMFFPSGTKPSPRCVRVCVLHAARKGCVAFYFSAHVAERQARRRDTLHEAERRTSKCHGRSAHALKVPAV